MTEKIIHEKEIGSDNEVETKNHLNLSNGDKERSSPSTSTPDVVSDITKSTWPPNNI